MIGLTLNHIKTQTGLKLTLCDSFKGLKELAGQIYFNVVLKEKTSESKDYSKLKRFADKYKTIRIEPNGVNRVAIFILAKDFDDKK